MRIIVLDANTDRSDFAARNPTDTQKFEALLRPWRPNWRFVELSIKDGVFPEGPTDADGFILTGSPSSSRDPDDWIADAKALVRDLHAAQAPLFAACFGHQLTALALGGAVEHVHCGPRLGITETNFLVSRPWMKPWRDVVRLYSGNKEHVVRAATDATVLGGDEVTPIAACAYGDRLFTTQYHPEMSPEFIRGLAEEMAEDVGPERLATARKALESPADGPFFGRWIAQFLEIGVG